MLFSGWRIYNASPLFHFKFPTSLTLGGWLGGVNHDMTGNYQAVWMISIALSVLGVLVHFFVDEKAVVHE